MDRRAFVGRLVAGIAMLAAGHARAEPKDQVVGALRDQGYRIVNVRRTWLGRIQILAEDRESRREVVVDRSTGEIMRDLRISKHDGDGSRGGDPDPLGRTADNSKRGSGSSKSNGKSGSGTNGKGNGARSAASDIGGGNQSDDSDAGSDKANGARKAKGGRKANGARKANGGRKANGARKANGKRKGGRAKGGSRTASLSRSGSGKRGGSGKKGGSRGGGKKR